MKKLLVRGSYVDGRVGLMLQPHASHAAAAATFYSQAGPEVTIIFE
jgi:hypothetical protein